MKMGIDPNNHRLQHTIRRSTTQVPNDASIRATSSSSKVHASPSVKSHGDNINEHDDGGVCPEDVPNLNLELTISFPSPSQAKAEDDGPSPTKCKMSGGSLSAQSPNTLLLFR